MKKMIYIIIGVVFAVIVLIGGYFYLKNSDEHVYLKHFNGNDSNLYVDCQQDSDCKFVNLQTACPKFESINKNNSEDAIKKFNNKELKLTKNVEFDCSGLPKMEDYKPMCINNICTAVKKDNK